MQDFIFAIWLSNILINFLHAVVILSFIVFLKTIIAFISVVPSIFAVKHFNIKDSIEDSEPEYLKALLHNNRAQS